MASTKAESTPIFIALILFVVLSIVLGVTTYMFYKGEEDAITARKDADNEREIAEKQTQEVQKKVDELKGLVGAPPDPAGPTVEEIMQEYQQNQDVYGETYKRNKGTELDDPSASTYPLMLKYLIDMNKLLFDQISQKDSQLTEAEQAHVAEKERLKAAHKLTSDTLDALQDEIKTNNEKFAQDRTAFEKKYEKATDDVRKAQDKITEIQDKSRRNMNKVTEKMNEVDNQLSATTNALQNARRVDLEAPDGEVIWVNQVDGTVYIDLGYQDGLRRQTSFSVYDHDVANALTAKPKGTLEVVQVKPDMSIAKVTSDKFAKDKLLNPILKGDKIISAVFHRGEPERFAVVGKIDIDRDGRSDLPLLLRLIERNGGVVDAFVDELGNQGGSSKVTPRTKYLVMGEKPTDKTKIEILDAYNDMVKLADDNGVRVIPLKDLLDHIGFEGQGRSVGLGRSANPDDFKPKSGDQPFRRRPAG
ncbi:MAG: hypothetical protein P8M53_03450 [Pirellulales bacterium]|nr:hypothetical protein [Pirellulales bacterium]